MSTYGSDGQHHRVSLMAERDTSANYRGEFSIAMRQSNATHPKRLKLDYDGNLTVSGDVIAYGSPSDKRLKENIKPINNALDTVQKLQGVTFDWKESKSLLDIKNDIGFIAQDVKEVLPELVRENEDGKMSLRDKGIVPVLVEAIKELKAEIEQLKSELKMSLTINSTSYIDDLDLWQASLSPLPDLDYVNLNYEEQDTGRHFCTDESALSQIKIVLIRA